MVDHDMYEDGEGAYVTARAWASDGVAIVSMFRYNPSLDGLAGIDPLHRWPASHCKANVDGVSGTRQTGEIPPYLCQVCYSKLGWELVLLQHGFEGGIEREKAWLEAQYAALKAFCNKWNKIPQFAAFVAWLEKRLEDRKGDNDDAAWPSNQEASVIDWPKTIRDMVDIHRVVLPPKNPPSKVLYPNFLIGNTFSNRYLNRVRLRLRRRCRATDSIMSLFPARFTLQIFPLKPRHLQFCTKYLQNGAHKYAKLEKINKFGLVYTFTGSDASLKPYLLAAHQDVVPVPDPSTWTHPPFDAYFDGEWLWGRGASDDKNSLTALMSAIETLLTETKWQPKRTVILAFGFDEECSGPRGAAKIGEFLTERYGDNSIPFILDEGGSGIQLIDDTLYVLPSVQEKGAIDIWAELRVKGGHSSIPHPHTGIGIMAEIISALESKPYEPAILKGSPVYNHLVCLARHSPDSHTKLHDLLKKDDLEKLKDELLHLDPMAKFTIQTTQAVDIIRGGQKINAMPEVVSLGVNYRVAPQDSLDKVQEQFVKNIDAVIQKYNLTLSAYEDDAKSQNIKPGFDYDGHLKLTAFRNSVTTPVSPTSGPIWDIFSGTIQHSFAFDGGKVVPVGEIMTDLSPNIYRWTPSRQRGSENIHTVDERIRIESHVDIVKFYYDLIRNFDAADF
ncbi:hypothetical protein FOXG_08666 [Fusarium oxysporum f. sp. lycopersici 4287]|uniref:Peptidase M20 dimerisation domain-containing protein n=2 Tax=Fusarium oxysporum TaxID=5507 RepID=A0A0J9V984_FUSO4|nr:hypothetical protein FOXG_08666 [Fusarium oxysporum f. sp. lycopersici 4287]KNB07536.1 hypothetical protein FOXG_08666 [Fusarium oxysporum f. sp. lycopersici 4287]